MKTSKGLEVLKSLDLRFTSGNDVPVTQAKITKEEYELIRNDIIEMQSRMEEISRNVRALRRHPWMIGCHD